LKQGPFDGLNPRFHLGGGSILKDPKGKVEKTSHGDATFQTYRSQT
jgi:hypothetical protein